MRGGKVAARRIYLFLVDGDSQSGLSSAHLDFEDEPPSLFDLRNHSGSGVVAVPH
jgi:hypothetical protein